jgi:hypothetical protein
MADVQLPLCDGLIFSSLRNKTACCLGRTILILVFALGAIFCSSQGSTETKQQLIALVYPTQAAMARADKKEGYLTSVRVWLCPNDAYDDS